MNLAMRASVISCDALIGAAQSPHGVRVEATGGPVCFEVEIANNAWSRAIGLMHRNQIDETGGMLFIYDPPQSARFWMKNVAFPLDILFIDHSGLIVGIVEDARPGDVAPHRSPGAVSSDSGYTRWGVQTRPDKIW